MPVENKKNEWKFKKGETVRFVIDNKNGQILQHGFCDSYLVRYKIDSNSMSIFGGDYDTIWVSEKELKKHNHDGEN